MSYLQPAPNAPPISDRLSLLWPRTSLVARVEGPLGRFRI
jgi:hypothetical protein